jgi:anthranilate 1,2-dioxygenase reductase subunit
MPEPLTAELRERTITAPGIAELWFAMRSPERLAFRAGQFVSIAVPPPAGEAAPALPRRSYSIASQSDAGDVLRFIIRVIPEGVATNFLMSLPLGAIVNMTGPHGFFVLDPAHRGDIVFGATGTGIAAVMPMLGELARRPPEPGPAHRRLILWGARQESDLCARAEIEELAARAGAELAIHLTAPPPSWAGGQGRITPALLDRLPALAAPTFYLVGNGAMISELKRELTTRGVNRKTQIRTEAFFD